MIHQIDEQEAQAYFERLDSLVRPGTVFYRYSEQDQEDIQFLMGPGGATLEAVREAVGRLPERFREDVVVRENLENLAEDIGIWRGGES